MGKENANSRSVNGSHNTKQPYSNQGAQLFFNQRPTPPLTEVQQTQPTMEVEQQPAQEVSLQTPTDILLAAILQELKTHNMIELIKLKTQQEEEQQKLQAANENQKQDDERFAEVRSSIYM